MSLRERFNEAVSGHVVCVCVCVLAVKLAEVARCLKLPVFEWKKRVRTQLTFTSLISRLKIVDDDIDWRQMVKEEEESEEDEEEAPVVRT